MIDWLLSGAHYVLSFALVISLIVFVHEFGHFIVARWVGVRIEVFSIGFGRELFGRTDKHGTRWKFSLWPLGGYVKMFGDAGAASTADTKAIKKMTAAQKKVSFHHKPLWAKALVVGAGPAANFILAIAVFTYFIFTIGLANTQPVVGEVIKGSPAQHAGLRAGDKIIKVDKKQIKTFNDIPAAIITNLGTPVELTVQRKTKTFTLTLTPKEIEEKDLTGNIVKRPLIGLRSQQITYEDVGFVQAVWRATAKTYEMCTSSIQVLGQMVDGQRSVDELKGPLGIAKLSGDVTKSKEGETAGDRVRLLLWFVALLSVNLGMVNLFPIPMLDGGHLLFYSIEALQGRPLAEKIQEYSFRFGFLLIAGLMALTLFNDMKQLFS